jgi:hypothetical protein
MTEEPARNQPKPLSQEQLLAVTELQNMERDFVDLCARLGKSRELSLAVTNMEQASMWAVRHLLNPK